MAARLRRTSSRISRNSVITRSNIFLFGCEWVLFLDADEWLPDALKQEISALIATFPAENGFYVQPASAVDGSAGYAVAITHLWILRLFRDGKGRCGGSDSERAF